MHRNSFLLAVMAILTLLLAACSSSGLPKQPGEYDLQPKTIAYDGREYSFSWADKDKSLHASRQDNIKMVQDSRSYLEMRGAEPVLHLAHEESITIRGEDRRGPFETFWFPFMIGQMMGGGGPVVINQPYPGSPQAPRDTPTYHYPPAGSFGRDDTLNGSITNNKPSAPDYSKVAPAPYAVSGKSGGTGSGTASSGKSGITGGQAGGTGTGSAASEKGGFRAGSSSFPSRNGGSSSPKVGAGSGKSSSGSRPSTGFSGGRAGGGARGGGK